MYTPSTVPNDPAQLPGYLQSELLSLAQAFLAQEPYFLLSMLHKAPTKPRDGMIVRADGTNWNPGSGSGFYGYRDAAWHLLG
ncbi:MAG: hypothetical protein JWQ89_3709 [Devosia sp.]|uniref:hypothetical protein n=1 Tax=Devosia sp. TaxID=1871048 RepID=UPI002617BE0E|nr:hypothetical protein [Devosia sp.]MDB5541982.1 hypothetical protein [Devosia sp.]